MIYGRLSDYYDQFIDDDLIQLYVDLVQSEKKEGTVMALGCGTAPLAVELASKNYSVSGSDISADMLDKAYNNAVNNGVHIQLYIHDILESIGQTFDIITMVSDVINYVQEEDEVSKVFKHVSDAMTKESIFVFDFLRPSFLTKMHNHHEDILLKDEVLEWTVTKTNVLDQVKHLVKLGDDIEVHLERTFPIKKYKELLNKNGLYIVKKRKTQERTILLCKKK